MAEQWLNKDDNTERDRRAEWKDTTGVDKGQEGQDNSRIRTNSTGQDKRGEQNGTTRKSGLRIGRPAQ